MPFVNLSKAASGPVKFRYSISTPESPSAEAIDPNLPTILFIHGVYIAQEIFTFQFKDPNLRRFNLVAIDSRGHGETEGSAPMDYGQEMAAEDIVMFMDAISLPACHFFGVSLGTIVALEIAVKHPERVKSLFLLSPLGLEEPADVVEGRNAIYSCWAECWKQESEQTEIDPEAIEFALQGGMELAFKDWHCNIVTSLVHICMTQMTKRWDWDHLDEFRIATLDIFTHRKTHSKDALAKLQVPVKLVHCLDDVAYPLEYSQAFLEVLKEAKVDASLDTVPDAPHFGHYEEADRVNSILNDFIESQTDGELPPAVDGAVSPWDDVMHAAGWVEDDEDSDDFTIVQS